MAQINIHLHGKPYAIACDDGQEQRVSELGRFVDSRVREIAASGAAHTDSHLLALTALVMSDELFEMRETINNLTRQVQAQASAIHDTKPVHSGLSSEEEGEILAAIDHLSNRIDSVADRIAKI